MNGLLTGVTDLDLDLVLVVIGSVGVCHGVDLGVESLELDGRSELISCNVDGDTTGELGSAVTTTGCQIFVAFTLIWW